MITFIFAFALGLLVGWNFLPQPQGVKRLVDKLLKR